MKTRRFLYVFSLLLIIIEVALEPSLSLFTHLIDIIIGKDGLITDYFIKGSQGADLFNAGLVGIITTTLLRFTNAEYDGNDTAAIIFMIHSLYLVKIFLIFGRY